MYLTRSPAFATVGRGDHLADRAGRVPAFCEWRVGVGYMPSPGTVAHDQYEVFIRTSRIFSMLVARVHVLAPVFGNNGGSRSILWLCMPFFSLLVFDYFHHCVNNFSHLLPGGSLAPCDTETMAITVPLVFILSSGGITRRFSPQPCKVLKNNGACEQRRPPFYITCLENIPDFVHHVGTYIPVMENGDFMFSLSAGSLFH